MDTLYIYWMSLPQGYILKMYLDFLAVLQRLISLGNTVIVIEHNLDVIKTADYIIDLGPEGGEGGGKVVAKGTPEEVVQVKASHTGQFLKKNASRRKYTNSAFTLPMFNSSNFSD